MVAELRVATKDEDPIAWASNQAELADKCLKQCDQESLSYNVEKAIEYCESAMEVFTKEAFPGKWADVQMQLCAAYMQRAEGVRRDNMEKAMRCFDACKKVRPDETLPDDFLKKHMTRGAAARKAPDRAATSEEE
jgi:hypothetical protein